MLTLSQTAADMVMWLLLHVGSRVSVAMIADFLSKLLRLPLPFFDNRTTGDIMQRIGDHRRVKDFLMGSSLDIVFSLLTFVVFAFVLALYSLQILTPFLLLSTGAIGWLVVFLKRRRMLDYKRFALESKERDILFEVFQAMPDIKTYGLQRDRRWSWERIAARAYQIDAKGLAFRQSQRLGILLISLRDIVSASSRQQ